MNETHAVTIRGRRHPEHADMRQYRAVCSCGWQGRIRVESRMAAQEDGWMHRNARSTNLTPRRAF